MKFKVPFLMLAALGGGCSEEDSSSSGVAAITASFLTESDLKKPDNISDKSFEEVLSGLKLSDEIYANPPEAEEMGETTDETAACFKDLMKTFSLNGEGETVSFGGEADLKACFENSGQSAGSPLPVTVNFARLKMYFRVVCPGMDASLWQGKTFKDVNEQEFQQSCGSHSVLINSSMEASMSIDIAIGGANQKGTLDMRSTYFQGSSAMGECRVSLADGKLTLADDCISVNISRNTNNFSGTGTTTENDYLKLTSSSLSMLQDKTSRWFLGGTIGVESNNWSGTLTYSGSDKEPAYSLSDSDSTRTGSLSLRSLKTLSLKKSDRIFPMSLNNSLRLPRAVSDLNGRKKYSRLLNLH